MPLLATSSNSIIPATQNSSLNLGARATVIEKKSPETAQSLRDLQNSVNQITSALQAYTPQFKRLAITDQNGKLIAWIGTGTIGNALYWGAWFGQLYVGSTGPNAAPFFVDNAGDVVVGLNGSISVQDIMGHQVGWLGTQEDAPLSITATSDGSPDVVTVPTNAYMIGDTLMIQGAAGDTAINGDVIVAAITGSDAFTLTTLTGSPINGNGAYAGGGTATRYFGGASFQTIAIGGTGFANAKIRAYANGNVSITNALITLTGSMATITLDPVIGTITVAGASNTTIVNYQGIEINSSSMSTGLSPGLIEVLGSATIALSTSLGIQVNGATVIDTSRNVNAASYAVGGVPGVSGSLIPTGTTITYLIPGGGSQSTFVLTGLSPSSVSFTDGLRTS